MSTNQDQLLIEYGPEIYQGLVINLAGMMGQKATYKQRKIIFFRQGNPALGEGSLNAMTFYQPPSKMEKR